VSGAKPHKNAWSRVVDAISLALVFGILFAGVHLAPGFRGQAGLLGALGFLLLAGTLMSELVEVLGVPHLTGYLLAGIIAGPHVLHLIDHESVKRLAPVNTLAIALIALAGGAELRLASLRQGLKSLVLATVLQTFLGIGILAGVFFAARPGFVKDMPTIGVLGVGILWGVVAITRSPSALLGILAQTRAQGPVANFSLAFILSSDIVVVVLLAAVLSIVRPMIEPGAAFSVLVTFREVGHELLGSIALGTTLGLVLAIYCRFVGRQLLLVFVALGFGMSEMLRYLQFEALLTFMVAGFVVTNLSAQGEKFLHAIEKAGGVVFVIFFATAGAHLDVPLLRKLWVVALVLAGARVAISIFAHRLSARFAEDPEVVRRWGWGSLISQAGLALGVAAVIERAFPSFGPPFRSLSLATVAINEMVGPILFKLALDRAGESSRAPAAVRGDHGHEATPDAPAPG
jgi:Kef-type K+ transport system membrane component KefB